MVGGGILPLTASQTRAVASKMCVETNELCGQLCYTDISSSLHMIEKTLKYVLKKTTLSGFKFIRNTCKNNTMWF